MSGGHFNYHDRELKYEIFGYDEKLTNEFEDLEISELVFDVLDLIHEFNYYASCDTSEKTWLKEKERFKKKWFRSKRKDLIKEIIDRRLKEVKEEIYKSFGVVEEC